MSHSEPDVNALIDKLSAYNGEKNYLSLDDVNLFTSWVSANPSDKATAELLYALQRYGIDTKERADWFNPIGFECFKVTTNSDVACRCLHNLGDSLYYTETITLKNALYIMKENRNFNIKSRAYKLSKSDFLAKVMALKPYSDKWIEIFDWCKYVITNYDDEYIDLLAFSLTNNEVNVPLSVRECFRSYLQNNSSTEAEEEILKLLASAQS